MGVSQPWACEHDHPIINGSATQANCKKVKASHTRYRALGPELIPV